MNEINFIQEDVFGDWHNHNLPVQVVHVPVYVPVEYCQERQQYSEVGRRHVHQMLDIEPEGWI